MISSRFGISIPHVFRRSLAVNFIVPWDFFKRPAVGLASFFIFLNLVSISARATNPVCQVVLTPSQENYTDSLYSWVPEAMKIDLRDSAARYAWARKRYGSEFLFRATWIIQALNEKAKRRYGDDFDQLFTDWGIMWRLEEFLAFVSAYPNVENKSWQELRNDFARHLGTEKVYRALYLTEAQAAKMKENGILPLGLAKTHFGLFTIGNWPLNWMKNENLYRLLEDKVTPSWGLRHRYSPVQSITQIPELAQWVAFNYGKRSWLTKKYVYVFELEIPKILILPSSPNPLQESFILGEIPPAMIQAVTRIGQQLPFKIH